MQIGIISYRNAKSKSFCKPQSLIAGEKLIKKVDTISFLNVFKKEIINIIQKNS